MKISIIIPCYKAELFLPTIIDDITLQTYQNYEVIFVSNGNDREKQEIIINDYIKKYSNFRLISTPVGNVSKARNMGILNSNGEYITFLDADDRISKYYLEKLAHKAIDSDIVIGGYIQYYEKEKKQIEYKIDTSIITCAKDFLEIGWNIAAVPVAKLYYKSFLINTNVLFSEEISYMEDGIFNYQLALLTNNITYVDQTGYTYLCRDNMSAVSRYHQNFQKAWEIRNQLDLDLHKKYFPDFSYEEMKNEITYVMAYESLQNIFKKGNPFSFLEKKEEVNNLLFKNPAIKDSVKNKSKEDINILYIIFNMLFSSRSSLLITIVYDSLHRLRNAFGSLYYKIRSWLWNQ